MEVARPVRRAGRGNPPAEKAGRAPRSDPYTYIRTRAGWVYAAFIIDAYSKYIVGWQTATTLRASLAIDALEMALATRRRRNHERLVHHSDRGGQLRFKGSSYMLLVPPVLSLQNNPGVWGNVPL